MNRILKAIVFFLAAGNMAYAQIVEPAKWTWKVVQKDAKEAELIATVKLDKDWHIYSQKELSDGPLPTVFTWPKIGGYSLVGTTKEPTNGHPDKMWEEQGV
ncbi:MAG TPA: hypothetical protein VD905_17400, partial [Flavobacteriales bacterium]|nr:hypothetical protein [Flavobacteriales bacterium]